MDAINSLKQIPELIQLFDAHYPGLKIEQLDNELVNDIIQNFISNMAPNPNYELADKHIPEMLLPVNLIYLNGKINNIPIKILFDTGATANCIYKSKIFEAGLDYLVDKQCKTNIQGIQSNQESYGSIWYTEIELELKTKTKTNNQDNNYAMIGLNLQIVNDDNIDKNTRTFDLILGIAFMKSYRVNIDFMTNTITLNNSIKINFD
jgi:hypothetical protein